MSELRLCAIWKSLSETSVRTGDWSCCYERKVRKFEDLVEIGIFQQGVNKNWFVCLFLGKMRDRKKERERKIKRERENGHEKVEVFKKQFCWTTILWMLLQGTSGEEKRVNDNTTAINDLNIQIVSAFPLPDNDFKRSICQLPISLDRYGLRLIKPPLITRKKTDYRKWMIQ